jgi:TnpA family transposase
LTQIPQDISGRDIASYYTFTQKELDLIKHRRRLSNRLGFAVQLALLLFPGHKLMKEKVVPKPALTAIADKIGVTASVFADYGARE